MAGLTKTYTRDLTTAIAGKLWEAIKDADEKHKLEKSKASEEVKEAAIKLKKEDSNSIPVQDKDLGETIAKIFGPLEGKLLQTEGKVENLSGKITAVAGSISDTQKLIINQNEILEDKFDQLLKVVGNKSAIQRAKEAESKFEQLELDLEKGNDLSDTFGTEKTTSRRGSGGGLLGFLLRRGASTLLKRSLGKIYRRFIPKRLQVRARQLRRVPSKVRGNLVKNFTKLIPGAAGKKIRNIVGREVVEGAAKRQIKKQLVKQGGKVASKKIPGLGWIAGSIFALERALKGDMEGAALEFASGIAGSIPTVGTAASLGIDAYIIKRDLEKSIGPQFERGNINPSGGVSGITDSISEILGVTKAFGDAAGFGPQVKGLIGEAGLSSYPTGKGDYQFDVGGSSGGGDIEVTKDKEAEIRKREKSKEDDKPVIDDKRTSGEKVGDMVGATIDEVDKFVDPLRKITGGKRDDGQFSIFGLNIRNPLNTKPKGGGGIGGDDNVQATTPVMGGDGATIEFWGQQGRDLSGEPGVDFSYKDYKSNYNLFPGYVLETGLLYGARYGNVVVVRSVDPSNGLEFDSLYSHFPDGGMAVKPGQVVSAGEYLGKVGFVSVDVPGVPQMQPNNAGNMSGWHTSVDFFEPGSSARYRNLNVIQSLVTGADGQSPVGLLEKLKPPSTSNDQSSLNNIEANSKLASTMTGLVEKGSNERMLTKRKSQNSLPIVIVNNQIINNTVSPILMGSGGTEDEDFFEAYNLARYTV